MAELERSLCADKLQFGMTRRWVLTDVMSCTSQRLKEIYFFLNAHKPKGKMKITKCSLGDKAGEGLSVLLSLQEKDGLGCAVGVLRKNESKKSFSSFMDLQPYVR